MPLNARKRDFVSEQNNSLLNDFQPYFSHRSALEPAVEIERRNGPCRRRLSSVTREHRASHSKPSPFAMPPRPPRHCRANSSRVWGHRQAIERVRRASTKHARHRSVPLTMRLIALPPKVEQAAPLPSLVASSPTLTPPPPPPPPPSQASFVSPPSPTRSSALPCKPPLGRTRVQVSAASPCVGHPSPAGGSAATSRPQRQAEADSLSLIHI